jgi:ubiquinone/menaquinone biosynthesis C-methylase UbiE
MATTLDFDDKATMQVEAIYSTPDVAATRIAVLRATNLKPGETVLDVGCGPGYLLRDLALTTGEHGLAIGIDISEPMLKLARERCAGFSNTRIETAEATALPVADASVDLACGLQIYAYVPEVDAGLAELHRAVKPGGRMIILDTDFDSVVWESRDRIRMSKVLQAYNGHVAWPDLPRLLPQKLKARGFRLDRCEVVPILTTTFNSNTYVFGIADFIHRFVIGQKTINRAEADAWRSEFQNLERDGAFFFSMNRYLFTVTRL